VAAAVKVFGSSQLSQFMDQKPLSSDPQAPRLALGPGG